MVYIFFSEGREVSEPFIKLPTKKELPEYYRRIKNPIDLSGIWFKIEDGTYNKIKDLEDDFQLLCRNVQTFNEDESLIFQDSITLQSVFKNAIKENVKTEIEGNYYISIYIFSAYTYCYQIIYVIVRCLFTFYRSSTTKTKTTRNYGYG